jgi:hypothetical protein
MIMFPGFLSDGTKELAHITVIMFPGFLSAGTKELARNYYHVYRVPERRNQRAGRQL